LPENPHIRIVVGFDGVSQAQAVRRTKGYGCASKGLCPGGEGALSTGGRFLPPMATRLWYPDSSGSGPYAQRPPRVKGAVDGGALPPPLAHTALNHIGDLGILMRSIARTFVQSDRPMFFDQFRFGSDIGSV